MNLTESEYRRIYAKAYGGKSFELSVMTKANREFLKMLGEAQSRPSPKVEPHKCRREIRKTTIRGERVEVEWRH